MHGWVGFLSSFLASSVEVVEAVTLVLAAGVTRGWRSVWIGVVAASVALAALVLVVGVGLVARIPLGPLRIVIGTLLLIFGLQWLRKAIMRYTGLKGLHDEAAIYAREVATLRNTPEATVGMDWTGFTVAFKGVLLEGLEVVFIVITFGLNANDMISPTLGAVAAAVVVIVVAFAVHQPLSRVPENTLKFVVGLMLTAFGTFWAGEGVGLEWPGGEWAILGLLIAYALLAASLIVGLRGRTVAGGKVVSNA